MAQCEKCGKKDLDMRDMVADGEKKIFVGPCCVKADPAKLFEPSEVQYGLEVSSHMGIRAYASYGGLTVEFKKTKEEVTQWFEKTEQEAAPPMEQKNQSETVEMTLN